MGGIFFFKNDLFFHFAKSQREETRKIEENGDACGKVCGRYGERGRGDGGAEGAEPAGRAEEGACAAAEAGAGGAVCDVAAGGFAAAGGVDGVVAG